MNSIAVDGQDLLLVSVRDITELDEVRLALERSKYQLRELIEEMPDSVGVYRHGRFVFVNSTLCGNLGYDEADTLIGMPLLKFIHPEDHQMARDRVQRMLQAGEKVPPADIRFFGRGGQLLTIEAHDRPITFDGEPAFVVIGRDVTHQRNLLARAMQLDRKIAVGTLVSGVSHEINNPLSYTKANIEFVLQRLQRAAGSTGDPEDIATEEIAEMIDALSDSASGLVRIATIVEDLETIADHHGGALASIDVGKVVQAALNLVTSQFDGRANVICELRDLPRVLANKGQLAEVFINVLTNALQSIDDKDPANNDVHITTACVDKKVTITISDSGCGMSEDVLACVFDPFFSTRPEGQGTGLGLTIAQNTLEKMGGDIEVDSVLGQGTQVRMWLPELGADNLPELDEETVPDSSTMS
jgi:PAS domain S-box-containing protein